MRSLFSKLGLSKWYGFIIILIFSVLCYVASSHYVSLYGATPATFGSIGASYQTYLNHDYLSFFTAMFIHVSWSHLFFNMILFGFALWVIYSILSSDYEANPLTISVYTIIGYVVSNIISIGVASIFYKNQVIAGGSGAVTAFLMFALLFQVLTAISDFRTYHKLSVLVMGRTVALILFLLTLIVPTHQATAIIAHWTGASLALVLVLGSLIISAFSRDSKN